MSVKKESFEMAVSIRYFWSNVILIIFALHFVIDCSSEKSSDANLQTALRHRRLNLARGSYRLVRNRIRKIPQPKMENRLTTIDFIRREGYPGEIHNTTTHDGFKLTLFRIPRGRSTTRRDEDLQTKRPIVLLVHGILCSSTDWVISGANNSLGFIMADSGYDVWLANMRGNTYSRENIYYDENKQKKEYWDFCWHEMGIYDMPTTIDYILATTGQSQLYIIGHSMGNTIVYVMCSERPQYNKKVKALISLAPIAYLNHVRSTFLRFLTTIADPLAWLFNSAGVYEYRLGGKLFLYSGQMLCKRNAVTKSICDNALFLIAGYDSTQINKTALPMILAHSPAGASSKQLVHYAQLIRKDRWFGQYDYGYSGNLKRYGMLEPPSYDLSRVKTPVTLIYSKNDWLADTEDVKALAKDLPNVYRLFEVPFDPYNHLDFIWAIDAKTLVYDECVKILKHFDET